MTYKGFTISFANIDRNRMYCTENDKVITYWPTFTAAARYVLTCTRAAEEPEPFFIAGVKYRCTRDVVSMKGRTTFKAGNVYEQTNEPTYWVGWLRNEQGERHGWPQPVYIPDTVKTWGYKPEDIDPRQYFEPVAA